MLPDSASGEVVAPYSRPPLCREGRALPFSRPFRPLRLRYIVPPCGESGVWFSAPSAARTRALLQLRLCRPTDTCQVLLQEDDSTSIYLPVCFFDFAPCAADDSLAPRAASDLVAALLSPPSG